MRALAAVALLPLAACGGLRENRQAMLHEHQLRQATAAYDAALGDTLARCTAAGQVAAAHADAGAAAERQAWEARRQLDCTAAAIAMGVTPAAGR